MKHRHDIFTQSLTAKQADALLIPFNFPLESERFCEIYDELAALDKKFCDPSLIASAAKILETFENKLANKDITADEKIVSISNFLYKLSIDSSLYNLIGEKRIVELLLPFIKKASSSEEGDELFSLISCLNHYDGPLFAAFMVFFKELVENDDLGSIYNFQDFLFQLDFERTMEDADASPNFHTRLLSELLTQIDDESKSSLLGTILKRYKSLLSSPMQDSYTHFVRDMLNSIYFDLNQESIINCLIELCPQTEVVKPSLKTTIIGDAIYFWEMSIGVMSNTHANSFYSKYPPEVFKKKIHENLTILNKTTENVILFAESFHYLYILVTNHKDAYPEFKRIFFDLELILRVLREGGKQFSPIIEALLNEDLDFSKKAIRGIKRLLEKDPTLIQEDKPHLVVKKKSVPAELVYELPSNAFYQEKIDLLRMHLSNLLLRIKNFKLALEDSESIVETDYSVKLKPWISLYKFLDKREKSLINFGRYLKKTRSEKLVSFDLDELDIQPKLMPTWSYTYIDAYQDEMEHFISVLRSIESNQAYASSPIVQDIPALIKMLSINISVASISDLEIAVASKSEKDDFTIINFPLEDFNDIEAEAPESTLSESERDGFTLTASTTPITFDERSEISPQLSVVSLRESPRFAVVNPLFQSLAQQKKRFEAIMLLLNPILVSLLSLSDYYKDSVELSKQSQDAKDLWQLMQQLSQWSERISTEPLGVDLFTVPPLRELPRQRVAADIVSPFYPTMINDFTLIIDKWNREINNFALTLKAIMHEDLSSSFNLNIDVFIEKLSGCYFYERNNPVYQYLQDVFGGLGTVEVFGAELFMWDNCDIDARVICPKQQTQEFVVQSILDELARKNPHGNNNLKVQEHFLVSDSFVAFRVINIKVPAGPNNIHPLDISVFPDGFFESHHYLPHAAASLNLKNGRLHCDHEFFSNILKNTININIRREVSRNANPLSREIHILKFLIRANFTQVSYLGKQRWLDFGPDAGHILATLKIYGSNLPALKEINPLLEAALRTLISRHFKDDQFTVAFLNRSMNLISFCQSIGCRLIATKGHQQFELGQETFQIMRLKPVRERVTEDNRCSLFFELTRALEAFLPPLLPSPHLMFGMFVVPTVPYVVEEQGKKGYYPT